MVSIFDQGPPSSCPSPFNMARHVLTSSGADPAKPALVIAGLQARQTHTYGELERMVRGIATGLAQQGLKPGDRVLMRLGNTLEFPLTFLAAIAGGFIPVPTSAMLTAPECSKIAAEIRPKLIVAGDGVALPAPCDIPVIGEAALQSFHALPPADYVMVDPERLGYIIYTSGTSGQPHAVCHAHRAIWARRMMWEGWYGLTAQDVLLHAGAFNWTYTLGTGLMDPWSAGATAVIPAQGVVASELPALLAKERVTIFAAAPGVYRQMLKQGGPLTLPELRHGLSAGEKLPDAVREAFTAATGCAIYEAYGMSECSTFISGAPGHPAPAGASGYPQKGRRVAVLGEDGAAVPFGAPGVLGVSRRDQGLMLGYWEAEAETESRFAGEWFLTGDTVSMDPDGAIHYLGRADDMMNAGGFRVSPLEVERVLNSHPEVQDSAAAEVHVKADTTVIAAFYVADQEIETEALTAFCETRLARYKTPRLFRRIAALPRGANNKILRRKLREEFEATHGKA
ncbi:class I adenylate-forming enzyme family protein [Pseudoruegeria sp. SHC-113]|uniref:class I adenylate-forming enzyme family protein n=1 Tax=Pseudoruegeria sp. SHC-113 TaxID=2855439 RepID=UPI0021BADAFE|nr:class I adenylate-forming enzyme family protein [Pseudoruegeria sp. SHC-113]MCT8160447.1 acyl--CoA ligase [Pseudoruegeria sp. SHC-113]